jgi:hypothetical protein
MPDEEIRERKTSDQGLLSCSFRKKRKNPALHTALATTLPKDTCHAKLTKSEAGRIMQPRTMAPKGCSLPFLYPAKFLPGPVYSAQNLARRS